MTKERRTSVHRAIAIAPRALWLAFALALTWFTTAMAQAEAAPEMRIVLEFAFDPRPATAERRNVEVATLEVVASRLALAGMGDAEIELRGSRIAIILADGDDRNIVLRLARAPGVLSFHVVTSAAGSDPSAVIQLPDTADPARLYQVARQASLEGDIISGARVVNDVLGGPAIEIVFQPDGAKDFEAVTAAHVGDQLAIVVDGVVMSAPTIQEAIPGGTARISGGFSEGEAGILAAILGAGPLPARMILVAESVEAIPRRSDVEKPLPVASDR